MNNLKIGDINVKEFGKSGNFLIKVEKSEKESSETISLVKSTLNKITNDISFRRVENVGPKVSSELLKSGIISICLALLAMLFYIWVSLSGSLVLAL